MKNIITKDAAYKNLINKIGKAYTRQKAFAISAVNLELLKGYWEIGQYIMEYEQAGKLRAEHGKMLLVELAKDLTSQHGKGFSRTNLYNMRQFYRTFPILQTLSGELSWSHYIELLSISDDLERQFYEQQTRIERWSIRELKRQKKTALFQRLALSKDKEGILQLAKEGHQIKTPDDLIKDPYIFEFLGIPEDSLYTESDLEERLLDHLQKFLLELGKGFAFIKRQYRITLNNKHYRIDLVFYHYILKCFVLIDLKSDKLEHYDVGQMNMYINYFKTEISQADDNPPIGIILTADKDDILVEYATGGITNPIFVSKYQLYLPDKEALQAQVRAILEREHEQRQ